MPALELTMTDDYAKRRSYKTNVGHVERLNFKFTNGLKCPETPVSGRIALWELGIQNLPHTTHTNKICHSVVNSSFCILNYPLITWSSDGKMKK